MSEEIIFGAHILETLTAGMYDDPLTIYREYVQNACDSLDEAVRSGIIADGEGRIDITIDPEARRITITDNGTGIKASDFRRVMGSVADSDKKQAENRGFRGIGRLCGMAYCRTVIFTAKFRGENVISRLECNSGILRELLNERDSGIGRYTASQVLAEINEFSTDKTDDTDAHYFVVELEGINDENEALLDYSGVKDYLSFTAPVPYSMTFDPFSSEIHEHAESLSLRIDEYDIFLNDDQLFKEYSLSYPTSLGGDEVFAVEFRDIRGRDGKLIAWMWFGLSGFKAQIDKKKCQMWGIRLRKGNMQVGDEYTMQKFFTEDRGNRYFIGELFCVDGGLIPNARRDYFNENPECVEFENAVKACTLELYEIYRKGSEVNSCFRRIRQNDVSATEIKHRINNGYFSDDASLEKAESDLKAIEGEIAKDRKKIDNASASSDIISRVTQFIQDKGTQFTQRGGGVNYLSRRPQNTPRMSNA